MRKRLKRESGYNLVEVLIAMALMGTVMLSIMGLFYLARGNVYSGKQMTQANAAATHAMEDLAGLTVQSLYDAFQIGSTDTLGTYTIDGTTYTNVLLRSTLSTIVASPPTGISLEEDPDSPDNAAAPHGFLTTWRNEITSNQKFLDPSVTLIISPRTPTAVMTAVAPIGPAPQILQVRVLVRWQEGRRRRSVALDTVKLRRN